MKCPTCGHEPSTLQPSGSRTDPLRLRLEDVLSSLREPEDDFDRDYDFVITRHIKGRILDTLGERNEIRTGPTDTERLDFLARLGTWGDGFAMQSLDDGSVYVRPWRKKLMSTDGFKDFAWYPTIRTAIDAAMLATPST